MAEQTSPTIARTGSIYIIRNTVNDKVYIGQTTMTVHERFMAHLKPSTCKAKAGYKLYNAMKKHGNDKFYVETIEDGVPLDKLDEREIELIAEYDSFNNGYNSTPGGDGRIFNKINNEEELLELAKGGMSTKKLAERYGVNKATVIRTLHHLDFYYRPDQSKIVELANSGMTYDEVADAMNCDRVTVQRALHRKGQRRYNRKVSSRESFDYDALVSDYNNQVPIQELCEKYGITKTTFYRIKGQLGIETRPQIYKHKIRQPAL